MTYVKNNFKIKFYALEIHFFFESIIFMYNITATCKINFQTAQSRIQPKFKLKGVIKMSRLERES